MNEAEDFVLFWQRAKTLSEVCQKFKIKPQAACERARKMRGYGVALKYFKKILVRRPEDYANLRKIAMENLP